MEDLISSHPLPTFSRRSVLIGAAAAATATTLGASLGGSVPASASTQTSSGDASVDYDAQHAQWTLSNSQITKVIELNAQSSQFRMTSLVSVSTGRDFTDGSPESFEFMFTLDGNLIGGGSGGWSMLSQTSSVRADHAVELKIRLARGNVLVTRVYAVFPNCGVITERTQITNTSAATAQIANPTMFYQSLLGSGRTGWKLSYLTGGGNFTGSGMLKTVNLNDSYGRSFDSKDAPEVVAVDGPAYSGVGSDKNATAIYDTLFIVRNPNTGDALWISFDYIGHWATGVQCSSATCNVVSSARIPGLPIAAGASVDLPSTTFGVATGDLDAVGNAIGDYTYEYLWDYTRRDNSLGTWQWRTSPQLPHALASADYARRVGATVVHIDDNWYDRKGDWSPSWASDDLGALSSYVQRNGGQIKVWSPFWHADPGSTVVKSHPSWLVGGDAMTYYGLHLNLANPAARAWMLNTAVAKQQAWNGYRWRYDGMPAWPSSGSENDMLGQSHGFFALLKGLKDANADATIDGCASGGELLLMEAVRYSDSQQLTDGAVRHYAGYWQSLKLPIDKIGHTFGVGTGIDTGFSNDIEKSAAVTEQTRHELAMIRWLRDQGVIGRWVQVFRPTIDGRDATYVLQRSNRDRTKSYITFSSFTPFTGQSVLVRPKGLVPSQNYSMRLYKAGGATITKSGSDWMADGVSISSLQLGEAILFNLDAYPGGGLQTTAPLPPTGAKRTLATHVGRSGTQIDWNMPTQTAWLSYVEIMRNGAAIDKVSVGRFWFGAGMGSDATYKIRSVNGDGVASAWVDVTLAPGGVNAPATPPPTPPTSTTLTTDFSLIQGQNNWSFQQLDTRVSGILYLTNMRPDTAQNRWQGDQSFALVYPGALSPDAPYEAVAKWVAPHTGTITVTGHVSLGQSGMGGDGTVSRIEKISAVPPVVGTILWGPHALPGNDVAGISHNLNIPVQAGDALCFIVNQAGTSWFDVTNWNPTITYI